MFGLYVEELKRRKKTAVAANLVAILCCLIFSTLAFVICASEDGDCDQPLQVWIVVSGIMYCLGIVLTILLISGIATERRMMIKDATGLIIFYIVLEFAWFILGNVWLYSSKDCEDQYTIGYTFMVVNIIIQYVLIILVCCSCCIALSCLVLNKSTDKPYRV